MIEKIINQNTLTNNAFWLVNKALAYHFQSISAAVLLSDLIAKEAYFSEKGQLTEDGFFFNTIENIEADTMLKRNQQDRLLNILIDEGILEQKNIGMPAKRHFKINHQAIQIILAGCQNTASQFVATQQTSLSNFDNVYNKNKGNKNKDNNTLKEKNIKKEKFDTFWKQYPRKVAKAVAEKSFLKLNPNDELFEKMLEALEQHKLSTQWLNHNGKYIPHASTWINQERWNDQLEVENRITSLDDIAF